MEKPPLEFNRKPHSHRGVCARRMRKSCVCSQRGAVAIRKCCGKWCVKCKGHVGVSA